MTSAAGLRILPVGAEAAELLAALHAEGFADPAVTGPAWTADTFVQLLGMPGCFALVAARGEEPIGLVLARTAADEAEILTVCAIPAGRRTGTGRHLVRSAASRAKADGALRLFLEVADGNAPARSLYAALGFREVGRRRSYYRFDGAAMDALILSLDLAP